MLIDWSRLRHSSVSKRKPSYKKKLKDYPEKERTLWRIFDRVAFEDGLAAEHVSGDEVLLSSRPLSSMDGQERTRALYLHAGLMYLNGGFLTNSSVRERSGITFGSRAQASRLIRRAVDQGAITLHDPDAAPSQRKYVPWWAVEVRP